MRRVPAEPSTAANRPSLVADSCAVARSDCEGAASAADWNLFACEVRTPSPVWVVLRVPYPMGFYARWLDGRIDDPNAGWKGRGLWASLSTRAPFHMEGGKGTTSKAVQLRPDPLAR